MSALDEQTPDQHRARYFELKAKAKSRAALPPSAIASAPLTLPDDVVVRRESIPGGWYWSTRLRRFQSLRLVNPTGRGVVSMMLWNADDTSERYNAGDTVKLQWTARLGRGRVLFSDMGRVLTSITDDTSGLHDTIVGPSSRASNLRRYGDDGLRNSRDNLVLAAGKFGLGLRDVPPAISFFADVSTGVDGRLVWRDGAAKPADFVDLRAEMNLLVAVATCPHPLDPNPQYEPQPAEAIVWRSAPPDAGDLCRNFGEEAVRGFENTDPLFAV